MFDTLLKYFDSWTSRWQAWIFTPTRLYPRDEKAISPLVFFAGNILIGYTVAALGTLTFLLIQHRSLVQAQIAEEASNALAISTGMFFPYAGAMFVAFFLGSFISYLGYRLAKSKIEFREHFNLFLELSFLEPLFILTVVLAFLIAPPSSWTNDYTAFSVTIVALIITRLWALVASYFALKNLHVLQLRAHRAAYFTAHSFSVLVIGGFGALIGWVVLAALVGGWE